jgi:pSer/pThr/pTyr-binding forkhead associated (FHA) protein
VDGSAAQPSLVYRDADGKPHEHVLRGSPVTIGRSSSCDVCLSWDARVSRRHARLELVGDDPTYDWTVVDDGSSRNGSYVNGLRITGRARLQDGDGLSVGRTLLVFRVAVGGPAGDGAGDGANERPAFTRSDATMFGHVQVTRASLSDSQYRVLLALARPDDDGSPLPKTATDEEIARELFLNVETVRAHLQILFERFGVGGLPPEQRRGAAVSLARAAGLLLPQRER